MSFDPGQAFIDQAVQHLSADFFPNIRSCLTRLDDAQIWWRPNQHSNSIGNLMLHLSGNVRQWIVSGLGGAVDERRRDGEFKARSGMTRSELLEQLDKTLQEAVATLQSLEPDSLERTCQIQTYEVTGLQAIFQVVEHFSYHTGQILFITKQLQDIDLGFYAELEEEEGAEEQS